MKLNDACISREGADDGIALFNTIIEDCKEAFNNGECDEVAEILFENGFEPDYIMDVLDLIC